MSISPIATATPTRAGFTYVELVASSLIVGMLCTGIGSMLFLVSETMYSSQNVVSQRALANEIAGDISENLGHAISFTSRSERSFTIVVPDRTGDQMPDKISYSWSGVAGDPLMVSFNGGPESPISSDVQNFHLEYISTYMRGRRPPPMSGSSVLMVVANADFLSASENERQTLIESWGYEVTLIDDEETQDNYDAALVENDVVYVTNDVDAAALAGKLLATNVGIVAENGAYAINMGFCLTDPPTASSQWISIAVDDHYITQEFPTSTSVDVLSSAHNLEVLSRSDSGSGSILAETTAFMQSYNALLTLDPGDSLAAGGEAAGRRVHLPWGRASLSAFTGEGIRLLKRSIEWGAGAGANSPRTDLLMVVEDPANLTVAELAQKMLFEDWNYKVGLIAQTESQSAFDAAIAKASVIYVPANIGEDYLGTKLRLAPVGVVNAANSLHNELGLADGDNGEKTDKDSIDIIEKRHYITFPFATGSLQIFNDRDSMSKLNGNTGNSTILANIDESNNESLAALETGQEMGGPDSDLAPARRVALPWGGLSSFDFENLNTEGRLILQRSLEWAAGAEVDIPDALFVVRTAGSLNGDEDDRKQTLESLGYVVTEISDHASQANFDAALAACDVVYVCETVDHVVLSGKLNATTVGVVNGHPEMIVDLGFSNEQTIDDASHINLTTNSHYITEVFPLGPLAIYSDEETVKYLSGNKAPGLQSLGTNSLSADESALAVINAGDILYGGGTAAGRRVSLPWGDGLSWDKMAPDGLTLLTRSLEWAMGEGDGGTPGNAGNKIGYEPIFANEQGFLRDHQVAMQITLDVPGMFTSLSGYFYKHKKVRYAIYTDDSGEPGNLLVETETLDGNTGPEWRTIGIPPLALPAGTYWLAFAFEDASQKYYYQDDPSQQVRYKDYDAVGDGFSSSWGTSDSAYTRRITFYGTFTAN